MRYPQKRVISRRCQPGRCILRLIVASLLVFIALPCAAQAPDVFQSAPGPEAPKPRARSAAPVAVGVNVLDGQYVGGAPLSGPCSDTKEEVVVSGGTVVGGGGDTGRTWRLHGEVSPDGAFIGQHDRQILTGKFQNGTFEGTYQSGDPRCGRRTLTLRRESPR
jgi:hypothetical protein